MKRTRIAIAITVAVAGAALGAGPAAADHLPGPCAFHREEGETVRAVSRRRIRCAADRFGPIPGGAPRAVCIARRESGLDPNATSEPTGQYRGLYQHDRKYWTWRYDTYTRPKWELSPRVLNGRTNAIVTIRMVADLGTWKRAGWPPKEC